jgi:hypothetical protein
VGILLWLPTDKNAPVVELEFADPQYTTTAKLTPGSVVRNS